MRVLWNWQPAPAKSVPGSDGMTLPALDKEGFLREYQAWNPEVAEQMAAREGVELCPDHWEVIELVRGYYQDFGLFPPNRVLVSRMREELGASKGSSIHLMKLFTGKPARVLARLSGLPKPPNCD